MELLNLFFFFIIFLLSYYSISGYGIIFNKYFLSTKDNKLAVNTDIISNFFTGIPLLIICGFLNYIFFSYNFIINFVCLSLGFVIFFFNVNIFKIFKISILPACLFIGLLISKTHDDFVLYHFQYLKELSDNTFKFGLGNIDLRYGFSNQLFSYKPEIIYLFKPEKFRRIKLEGGSYVFQFNQEKPISGFVNSIYTLGLEKNYLKIYRNQFVKGSYYTELINGLNGGLGLSYNKRSPLFNSTAFTFNDGDDFFIPNDPLIQELLAPDKKTNALIAELKFDIHFKQKYYTRPHEKVIIGSKFPSLEILYRKGMNEVDFDFVEATIKDDVKIGLLGLSEYNISAGYFLNANIVSKADMKHFNGNQTILAPVNHLTSFQLLPYYYYSTQNYFLEAHYEHHFGGFILNKIPLLRKLNLKEVAGIHYLKTKEINYAEINIGLENLFKILRVDWVTSYSNTLQLTSGIRIGLNLFGGAVSIIKE